MSVWVLKQWSTNQISYVSVGTETMKWSCVWYWNIFCGRTNVPIGFFVTGSLLDRRHQPCNCLNKSCLRVDCFNYWLASPGLLVPPVQKLEIAAIFWRRRATAALWMKSNSKFRWDGTPVVLNGGKSRNFVNKFGFSFAFLESRRALFVRVLMLVGDKIRFFVLPASARWNEPGQGGWVVKEIWRSPRRQSTGHLFGPVTCVCGRFEKFLSCVHRKFFMLFQTQTSQSNFLCECR